MDKRNGSNYSFRIALGIMMLVLLFVGNTNAAVGDDIEVNISNIWGSDYPILLFNQSTALGQVRTADLDTSPISEPLPTLTSRPRNEDKSVVSRFKISDTKVKIVAYIAGGRPFWPGSEGYIKIINPEWKITEILRNDTNISNTYFGSGLNFDINNGTIEWQGRGGCPDCAYNENEFIFEFIVEKVTSVHNINKGTNYTTIQAAIDDANPGDVIHVNSGTYYENVNVSKQLTLRGIGMPVVDANGSGNVITLTADGIILEGFTATGGSEAGIKVISNNNLLINNDASNNGDFGGNGTGISLSSSNNNTLSNNTANSNSGSGLWSYGYGISLSLSNNNTLRGNAANSNCGYGSSYDNGGGSGYGYGIFLSSSNNNTLRGNTANSNCGASYDSLSSSGYGISLSLSNNNMLSGNTANSNFGYNSEFSSYGYGISLSLSNNNMLSGNTAISNFASGTWGSGDGYGISLSSSNNNTLSDNTANSNSGICSTPYGYPCQYGSGYGISLSSSKNNTLSDNTANSNFGWGSIGLGNGISLFSSSNNTLSGNIANSNSGRDNGYGLSLSSSNNNTLRGNTANSNSGYGYDLDGYGYEGYIGSGYGILLDSSNNNTLSGNTANSNSGDGYYDSSGGGSGYGILLDSSNNNTLSDNTANSNFGSNYTTYGYSLGHYYGYYYGFGISLSSSSNNTLSGNTANSNYGYGGGAYGSGYGLSLSSSSNNKLSGNNVSNNNYGINLFSSNDNTLKSNNATSNSLGIFLNSSNFNNITSNNISNSTSVGIKVYDTSKNNTISDNKVTNSSSGIFFVYAFNTTASNNIMENNSFNFGVGGNLTSHFDGNNIDTTNLANGRPIYYVKHGKNIIYGSSTKASTFYCILCNNVTVKDLEMSNMDRGVYFWETSNSRIQNIRVKESGWGVYMRQSHNNTIKDSKFSTNNLQDYSEIGVSLYSSDNNTFENNSFILNKYGIELFSSSRNTIYNNYFNNTNNFIFKGISYKNNWNTTKKPGTNIIGGSYLGGNLWANPTGNGFSQTCTDTNNDGLCDLKYSLNSNNSDSLALKYQAVPPRITVISPNGGENWTRGTTKTINWTSTGSPGAYVKIELLKPGIANKVIILSTLNDGSHPWPISATQATGSDYKIKITSTTNAAYTDTSDDYFTIPTPNISVITPNGGETWRRGTTQTIKWNSNGSSGTYVKIELMKAGVANRVIIASTLNDGSHPWLIPAAQAPGTDYKIRVSSITNLSNNDTSDNSFTIPVPSFTVVSPNGSENWTRGTNKTIRWNSTESPGTYVKIELLKPGVANKVIVASTLNDGTHPWLIPANQAPGTDYKVKITSTINASVNDTSDNNFSIVLPKIIVTSPNGGENWTRGTAHLITWNYTGNPGTYVKIELLKGGALNRTILASTLNDKSQGWTIPAAQAPGEDYKIRITSTTNLAYNDTSDSNFNISSTIP